MARTESEYLTPQQLSQRWAGIVREKTLANWRYRGTGPAWTKRSGLVVYRLADVEAFEREQRKWKCNE